MRPNTHEAGPLEGGTASSTSLTRSVLSYTTATLLSQAAAIVQSILVIRWMDPAALGVWLGLQLIAIYGAYAPLGILTGLNRQVPFHRGRKEFDHARRIEDVARGSLLVLVVLGLGVVAVLTVLGLGSSQYGRGAIALGLATVLTLGVRFHEVLFRARNEFGRAGLATVVNTAIVVAGLPLVYYWHYDGLLVRVVLASVLTLVACFAMNGWSLGVVFSWAETRALMRVGLPIMAVTLALATFVAMDRTLILWLLDERSMGYYALCFAVAKVLKLFPTTIGQVFYPRMTELYGAEGVRGQLLWRCVQASILSVVVVAITAVAAARMLPWAVTLWFPKYEAGLPALRIALIAYVVHSLAAGPTYFLITTMQKRRQLGSLLVGTVVMILVATQIVPRTLEGIAWSLVSGISVYVAGLWAIVLASARRAKVWPAQ